MRPSLVRVLRCPRCRAEGKLRLDVETRNAREVRSGTLTCIRCSAVTRVDDGIVDVGTDQPEFVTREAAGLERFAEFMRASGWTREDVLALPYREDGYWYAQATAIHQMLGTPDLDIQPGMRILDVGSNTCWATAMFAERGLEAVALDIATAEIQGLKTADWWFDAKDIYFERVPASMFDTNLCSNSFDLVWCCEVLHHNHLANLRATFVELNRILKPGGKLLVVNEPLRTVTDPKLHPGKEVAQFEGHEHAYTRRRTSRRRKRRASISRSADLGCIRSSEKRPRHQSPYEHASRGTGRTSTRYPAVAYCPPACRDGQVVHVANVTVLDGREA